jgi:hypothetical protein
LVRWCRRKKHEWGARTIAALMIRALAGKMMKFDPDGNPISGQELEDHAMRRALVDALLGRQPSTAPSQGLAEGQTPPGGMGANLGGANMDAGIFAKPPQAAMPDRAITPWMMKLGPLGGWNI